MEAARDAADRCRQAIQAVDNAVPGKVNKKSSIQLCNRLSEIEDALDSLQSSPGLEEHLPALRQLLAVLQTAQRFVESFKGKIPA